MSLYSLALTLTVVGMAQAQNWLSPTPRTKATQRASMIARSMPSLSNYYSRRNHDSRRLLIEAAVSTEERIMIHRNSIRLVTPEEVEVTW